MLWDPSGAPRQALWIGGGQWAGKSTVARILAFRHGITAYRRHQLGTLTRAGAPPRGVSDPERAQRNRIARDRLVAEDAVRAATALGMPVVEIDGSLGAEGIADIVAEHFSPYLGNA
ncbi:hypothetical protein ACPPVO_10720 [Dactylosporangium sp. McL0621]|uniref:hypothetical protein n=1 Tax=Dactylosporangium sp. McL0621 TaxID=3415678 RepID=UPI003CF0B0B0